MSHAEAFVSTDALLDHCGVRVVLCEEKVGSMPPLEAMRRPLRLRLDKFKKRQEEWREAVSKAMEKTALAIGNEPFARLVAFKKIALACARTTLGTSGGRLRSAIPFHSAAVIRLQARLRLLRVVRRELYTRQERNLAPSRAMRKAWDSDLGSRPADYAVLTNPWSSQNKESTDAWLRRMRQLSHVVSEELDHARKSQLALAAHQSRNAAIARFYTAGELRRILRPQLPSLHSPQLQSEQIDCLKLGGS